MCRSLSFCRRDTHDYYSTVHNHAEKNYYIARPDYAPVCPDCGGTLTVRDSRKRSVKNSDGERQIFALRRLYCPRCKQIHTEIPDCIIPNKHYSRATIEAVRSKEIDYCSADNKTIYRWRK